MVHWDFYFWSFYFGIRHWGFYITQKSKELPQEFWGLEVLVWDHSLGFSAPLKNQGLPGEFEGFGISTSGLFVGVSTFEVSTLGSATGVSTSPKIPGSPREFGVLEVLLWDRSLEFLLLEFLLWDGSFLLGDHAINNIKYNTEINPNTQLD